MLLHPSKEVYSQYKGKTLYFQSEHETLHAVLFMTQAPSKGLILQYHGNAQNLTAHYQSLHWLVAEGYDLLTFDYREFGRSTGTATLEGVYRDSLAALIYAKEMGPPKLIVYGQSLGAALALKAVSEYPVGVSLVVSDSGFTSYPDVVSQHMRQSWVTLPFAWIPYLSLSGAPSVDPLNLTVPMLIIHDTDDPLVSYANSKDLYEKAVNSKRSLWSYTEGTHISAFNLNKGYRGDFLRYLEAL